MVWKGDQTLPTDQQGVVVLGAPLGHPHFITRILQAKTEEHSVLFRRILAVQDLQCAWLLLLFCAATRANYFLWVVQPDWSEPFAAAHGLPLALGRLGLRSAVRSQTAYWASWADSLPRIREKHPRIADLVGVPLFCKFPVGNNLQAAATCRERLVDSMPQNGGMLPEGRDQADPQRTGTPQNHVWGGNVWPALTSRGHFSRVSGPSFHRRIEPSSGPNAVHLLVSFTCSPVVVESRLEPQIFRVLSCLFGAPPSLCSLLPVRPSP